MGGTEYHRVYYIYDITEENRNVDIGLEFICNNNLHVSVFRKFD